MHNMYIYNTNVHYGQHSLIKTIYIGRYINFSVTTYYSALLPLSLLACMAVINYACSRYRSLSFPQLITYAINSQSRPI